MRLLYRSLGLSSQPRKARLAVGYKSKDFVIIAKTKVKKVVVVVNVLPVSMISTMRSFSKEVNFQSGLPVPTLETPFLEAFLTLN